MALTAMGVSRWLAAATCTMAHAPSESVRPGFDSQTLQIRSFFVFAFPKPTPPPPTRTHHTTRVLGVTVAFSCSQWHFADITFTACTGSHVAD